jgi:hypothetical protein
MASSGREDAAYAAGQAREFLRGELEGKPNRYHHAFAGLLDDPDLVRWLAYQCSLWAADGRDYTQTDEFERIMRSAASVSLDEAFREGNISQLQGSIGLVNQSGDAADALAEIVRRLAHEGTIAVVTGPPGAGKTATVLDVVRAWVARTGGRAIGNVGWEGFDATVDTDLELLEAMAAEEGQALGVIDEAAQDLTGRGADSVQAETFCNRSLLIRKQEADHGPHAKRGSLILVGHNWRRLNAPTRRLCTLVVAKPSRADPGKVVLYESPGGEDERSKIGEFVGLTDTRETYPEHEASEFRVVLEDEEDGEDELVDADRQRQIETALRAVLVQGQTQVAAAELVDYGRGWVGDRVREWHRGDHRALLPAEEIPDDVDGAD